jgi:hypothetical protein
MVGGGAVTDDDRTVGAFHLGARGDVLFLRRSDRDMAVGPFVDVGSENFRSLSVEGGIDWLVPASVDFPFILAAGAFDRFDRGEGPRAGALAEILWGSRGYNFDSHYDLSFQLFVEGRYAPGSVAEEDLLGGIAVDLSMFAYPVLLAIGALK